VTIDTNFHFDADSPDTTNAVNILGYNHIPQCPMDTDFNHHYHHTPREVIDAVSTIADHAIPERKVHYKYRENEIIADFLEYINDTYGQHYKTETHRIECFDAWIAMGDATPTFRNTAIKYLWRYGKKTSYTESKKDLFKALHYVLMCLYNDHYSKRK
jgi:hypothetical protein